MAEILAFRYMIGEKEIKESVNKVLSKIMQTTSSLGSFSY